MLRLAAEGDVAGARERITELAHVAEHLDEPPLAEPRQLPAVDPIAGYAEWAASYDDSAANVTVTLEEEAVRPLLAQLPEGPLLDAGCGTGRHTVTLAAAGRDVTGVDASAAMVERARQRVPDADFGVADLDDLPFPDASFSGVVCALALSHLPRLGQAVREIGRVLRPGGRAIVSNPHPNATALLAFQARFSRPDGTRAYIPEYPHMLSEYVEAFAAANLVVTRCLEPVMPADLARSKAKHGYDDAYAAALAGLPVVLVWEVERV